MLFISKIKTCPKPISNKFKQQDIIANINDQIFKIKNLGKKINIIICIPGHIGIQGNELADKTALDATINPQIETINIYYTTYMT